MRHVWFALGAVAVALGILGAFLPLLPTTPFLLLAAFAFSRSSPRLEAWIVNHPRFGPPVRDWRERGAIGRRAKRIAVAVMVATPVVSWLAGASLRVIVVQCVVLAGSATFVLTRPD